MHGGTSLFALAELKGDGSRPQCVPARAAVRRSIWTQARSTRGRMYRRGGRPLRSTNTRCSTFSGENRSMATGKKQGARGFGIEAQRNGVANYLNGGRWTLLQEFVEVESGAKSDNRPQLAAALAMCPLHKAKLIHRTPGQALARCPPPAWPRQGGQRLRMCGHAERNAPDRGHHGPRCGGRAPPDWHPHQGGAAAAKAHGTRLGDDRGYRPTQDASGHASSVVKAQADARARDVLASIKALQDSGSVSLRAIAAGLNSQGIPTARGGTWSAMSPLLPLYFSCHPAAPRVFCDETPMPVLDPGDIAPASASSGRMPWMTAPGAGRAAGGGLRVRRRPGHRGDRRTIDGLFRHSAGGRLCRLQGARPQSWWRNPARLLSRPCPTQICRGVQDTQSPFAREVIERLQAVYAIEAEIRGNSAERRLASRRTRSAALMRRSRRD